MSEKAQELINTMVGKINDVPDLSVDWGQAVIFHFLDVDQAFRIKFAMDGKVEKVEKGALKLLLKKGVKATFSSTSSVIESILDKTVDLRTVLASGAMKVEGDDGAIKIVAMAFL